LSHRKVANMLEVIGYIKMIRSFGLYMQGKIGVKILFCQIGGIALYLVFKVC